MGKHNVDIKITARNEANNAFRSAGNAALDFGKTIKMVIGGLAIRSLAIKTVEAYNKQEQAIMELDQAFRVLGDTTEETRERAGKFASEIQRISIYGDETVLQLQAMGANIGHLTGQRLERATIAAIGLSRAFRIDVNAAMKLVSRASMGQTQTLNEYGIVLDKTLSPQDQFNQLLGIGEKYFKEMTSGVKTFSEEMKILGNVSGDTLEKLGAIIIGMGQNAKGEHVWVKELRNQWYDVNDQLDAYIQLKKELQNMDLQNKESPLGIKEQNIGKTYGSSWLGTTIDNWFKNNMKIGGPLSIQRIFLKDLDLVLRQIEENYNQKKNAVTIGDIAKTDITKMFSAPESTPQEMKNINIPFNIPMQSMQSMLISGWKGLMSGAEYIQKQIGGEELRQSKFELLKQQSLAGDKEASIKLAGLRIEEEMLPLRTKLRDIIQNQLLTESQRLDAQKMLSELGKVEAARLEREKEKIKDDKYNAGYVPDLQLREGRFLTTAPGSRMNKTEQNTTIMAKEMRQTNKLLASLDKKTGNRSGGVAAIGSYQLAEGNIL